MFKDREEAAFQLAAKLKKYKNADGVVLAVPRGGVPIGYIIARQLGLPLEIVLSKKIGHPYNPEFAIGSVHLNGVILDNTASDISEKYINDEVERIQNSLKDKFKLFMGNRKPVDLENKTVIIVDDGIATGNTILATVEAILKNNPKEIIIAVPVAPPKTVKMLSNHVNEIICLQIPENFHGVGQFYNNFTQVRDEEVIELLKKANREKVW